jgi:membrane-bound lytic murein transglycosylase D
MLRSQLLRILLACNLFLFFSASAGSHTNISAEKFSAAKKLYLTQKLNTYVTKFIVTNNETFERIRKNNHHTFKMMDGVFSKYRLPIQLKYLAVVESELKSSAVSKVGAVGTWQLMPETAKILGLKITDKYDERKNNYKSTHAAAIYLRDLHTEFNDWLLVLAAYNCGPGPVYKAIQKAGSRNFWDLQRYLPAESRGHVKKFIAAHYYFEGTGCRETLGTTEQ